MQKKNNTREQTQWIKNPLVAKWEGLKPTAEICIKPYFGRSKKINLLRTQYFVGAGCEADIVLDDPFVSKQHGEILLSSNQQYVIRDCGSKNGIFLNGTRISEAFLPAQGILRIGRSFLSWDLNKNFNNLQGAISLGNIVAESEKMKKILNQAQIASRSDLPILLLGETGVGKDEIAQLIHHWSKRANGAYVAINAARVSGEFVESEIFGHKRGAYTGAEENRSGALMQANNGTFFLDELGDLPSDTQAKFLRVLERGEIKALGSDVTVCSNFRLISATSKNIEEMVKQGYFRMDLYYRISGFVIRIPALRERKEDIIPIAKFFAEKEGMVLAEECKQKLLLHNYPGNIRELKSIISRAIAVAKESMRVIILESDIEFSLGSWRGDSFTATSGVHLETIEKEVIRESLIRSGGSKSQAAKDLGISRTTLFEKIKKYQIYSNITS